MGDAIQTIERLCQEKLLVFHDLLSVFRQEKKSIIQADVGALWKFTEQKHELAESISRLRKDIMDAAVADGLIEESGADTYSLDKIIVAVKGKDKETLVHLRQGLTQIKTKIAALAQENRRYLEESLRTIEDLVQIIVRNSDRSEHYGRDSYVRTGPVRRAGVVLGEV